MLLIGSGSIYAEEGRFTGSGTVIGCGRGTGTYAQATILLPVQAICPDLVPRSLLHYKFGLKANLLVMFRGYIVGSGTA